MSKIYKKYQDLAVNPFSIDLKKIKLKKIISYPPAGKEVKHLKILNHFDCCSLVPQIYEMGVIDKKKLYCIRMYEW